MDEPTDPPRNEPDWRVGRANVAAWTNWWEAVVRTMSEFPDEIDALGVPTFAMLILCSPAARAADSSMVKKLN